MDFRRVEGDRETIGDYDPCWLRYERIEDEALAEQYRKWCGNLTVLGSSPILESARDELTAGISSLLASRRPSPAISGTFRRWC